MREAPPAQERGRSAAGATNRRSTRGQYRNCPAAGVGSRGGPDSHTDETVRVRSTVLLYVSRDRVLPPNLERCSTADVLHARVKPSASLSDK